MVGTKSVMVGTPWKSVPVLGLSDGAGFTDWVYEGDGLNKKACYIWSISISASYSNPIRSKKYPLPLWLGHILHASLGYKFSDLNTKKQKNALTICKRLMLGYLKANSSIEILVFSCSYWCTNRKRQKIWFLATNLPNQNIQYKNHNYGRIP